MRVMIVLFILWAGQAAAQDLASARKPDCQMSPAASTCPAPEQIRETESLVCYPETGQEDDLTCKVVARANCTLIFGWDAAYCYPSSFGTAAKGKAMIAVETARAIESMIERDSVDEFAGDGMALSILSGTVPERPFGYSELHEVMSKLLVLVQDQYSPGMYVQQLRDDDFFQSCAAWEPQITSVLSSFQDAAKTRDGLPENVIAACVLSSRCAMNALAHASRDVADRYQRGPLRHDACKVALARPYWDDASNSLVQSREGTNTIMAYMKYADPASPSYQPDVGFLYFMRLRGVVTEEDAILETVRESHYDLMPEHLLAKSAAAMRGLGLDPVAYLLNERAIRQ